MISLTVCFSNKYVFKYHDGPHKNKWDVDHEKVKSETANKLQYYRPVQAGIATIAETKAMGWEELLEINQIADTLLEENAIRIANSIGKLFATDDK